MRFGVTFLAALALCIAACSSDNTAPIAAGRIAAPSVESTPSITPEVQKRLDEYTMMAQAAVDKTFKHATTAQNPSYPTSKPGSYEKSFNCDLIKGIEFESAKIGMVSRFGEKEYKHPIPALLSIVKYSCVNRLDQEYWTFYGSYMTAYDAEFETFRCNYSDASFDEKEVENGDFLASLEAEYAEQCGWTKGKTSDCGEWCDKEAEAATAKVRAMQ